MFNLLLFPLLRFCTLQKVDFERGYLRIWSPPEKYLGRQWLLQNFTNSLFPKYEGHGMKTRVPKIGRAKVKQCHFSNTYYVLATVTNIIISFDSLATSQV